MKLVIIHGPNRGMAFEPGDGITTIGREDSNDIQQPDDTTSNFHIELRKDSLQLFVKDLDSSNGTFVNGSRIRPDEEIELFDGDRMVVGLTVYEVDGSVG